MSCSVICTDQRTGDLSSSLRRALLFASTGETGEVAQNCAVVGAAGAAQAQKRFRQERIGMGKHAKAAPPAEETPLHDAARNGDVEEMTRLLALTPASLNSRDRHSRTPLHMAAWAGQTEAVRLLCERKADIKAAAGDDMAAIHFASQKGHLEAVRVLLAAKAEANSLTRKGMTPLHMAVQGGHKDLCTLLIKKGANLLTKNKAGKTPLDLVKDEELSACLKAAESERRALIEAKKNKQESKAGGSDSAAENVDSATGAKRELSESGEEVPASNESRKKAKVLLSHLDAEEAEEES